MSEHSPHGAESKSHSGSGKKEGIVKKGISGATDLLMANGMNIVTDLPNVIGEFFGAGGSHGKSSGGHSAKH
jgi:hypothetical protein